MVFKNAANIYRAPTASWILCYLLCSCSFHEYSLGTLHVPSAILGAGATMESALTHF